jgi:hypothetical protein
MKLSSALLTALFSIAFLTGGAACTGTITDGGFADDGPGGDPGGDKTPEEQEEERALCVGDGEAGGACEVTADCAAPQICHSSGVCVGPKDPAYTCDPIEGVDCLEAGESCVNGLCIAAPGACETLDDCPNGFVCDGGQCTPERDGSACSDPGPGPALAGTYKVESVLRLRDGLPDVVDKILDASETARDIVNGDIDLDLPSAVEFLIGGIVAGVIRQYVPPYGIDIVNALGTMSDVLNTMGVEGTLKLEGQACDGNYRGSHQWDFVKVTLQGRDLRIKPEQLPGVTEFLPEDFSARYHCGDLLIDRHRIQGALGQLIRWVLDTGTEAITGHPNVESALGDIVDCPAVGNTLASACSICGALSGVATGACQGFVQVGVAKVGQAIDEAAVKLSLLKLKAVVPVNADGSLGAGTWYGSLVGGDFKGTLAATKN